MMDLLLPAIFTALTIGAVYALIALGLALVFGAMKIINLAHGELVLLAAYIGYMFESQWGYNPYLAIPVAFLVVGLIACLIFILLNRITRQRELNSLIFTYSFGIIITNAILVIARNEPRMSAEMQETVEPLLAIDIFATYSQLIALVLAILLMLVLWLWLKNSWYGRAVRAVTSNRNAAKLMGVNPVRTELVSFVIGALLATVAGIALYTFQPITPGLGHMLTIKAFIITVLAGIGSIPGVLIGSILLALAQTMTESYFNASFANMVSMLLFLAVLIFLPNGLFGKTQRRG
ncbi:branched-chain amino acid ABC transporter permease [Bartonella apis]|uniref:branched-chain amino acid ABC transporter permease n=1 Tax=Bartonella apis TaxID=1686310 RepID=UPI00096AC1A4|nr:branched-chain amino acid ABC transporter permease [Bartonella apis]